MSAAAWGRCGLLLPAFLGVLASTRGPIGAKLGVPLSCACILVGVHLREWPVRRDLWALAAALGFSAAGDWFLSNRGGRESYFLVGIALFFCAHLGYLGFSLCHGRLSRGGLGLLLVVFVPYFGIALWPRIGSGALALAVFLYLLISCVALAGALGLRLERAPYTAYVAGMVLIVFSDTLISFNEFLRYRAWNSWILPTYYLAHLCVTWAAMGLRSEAARKHE
jgi:uncharacterized membrane protein YhhN